MTPEEYARMYQQTYGVSAYENNSYLHCNEDDVPEWVTPRMRQQYRDFEGAIRFMDDEYLTSNAFASYGDNDSERDLLLLGYNEEGLVGIDAPDTVCGFPMSTQVHDTLEKLPITEDSTVKFGYGTPDNTVSFKEICACPCFQLSLGNCSVRNDYHDCEECDYCNKLKSVSITRFLTLGGAEVYFSDDREMVDPYPRKKLRSRVYRYTPFSLCGYRIASKVANYMPLLIIIDGVNLPIYETPEHGSRPLLVAVERNRANQSPIPGKPKPSGQVGMSQSDWNFLVKQNRFPKP